MDIDGTATASRRHATDGWEQQFQHNIEVLETLGNSRARAQCLVSEFVRLADELPMPGVLRVFEDPAALMSSELLTEATPEGRAFMLELLNPVMACVSIDGTHHLDHSLAGRLVVLAGRFASQAKFARPALTLFSSLLVCSPWDMGESPDQGDLMGRINRRAFRLARRLQYAGRVLALFPEGTRSLDGRPGRFLASLYPYLVDTVVLPIRLENLQALLPNSGLVFRKASASLHFGELVWVGARPSGALAALVTSLRHIDGAHGERSRQAVLDDVAALGGGEGSGRAQGRTNQELRDREI